LVSLNNECCIRKAKDRNHYRSSECGLFRKLFFTEALFELRYASTSIENALLACVERMADRTNFNIN
jgi:hypothetical protein